MKKIYIIVSVILALILLVFLLPQNKPSLAKQHLELAIQYKENKEYAKAINEYTQAMRFNPSNASLYNDRGVVYELLEKYRPAVQDYLKAVELDYAFVGEKYAYPNLVQLVERLKKLNESLPTEESTVIGSYAVNYLDKGINTYKINDYDAVLPNLKLALKLFLAAYKMNPSDTEMHGFIYVTKGFMYYTSGIRYLTYIQEGMSNYDALVYLRSAYYALSYAKYYFNYGLQFMKEPRYLQAAKSLEQADGLIENMMKQVVPQVDFEGTNYINNINLEARCAVNFDIINDKLTSRDFNALPNLINENQQLISQLGQTKSKNAIGFAYLLRAYSQLGGIVSYLGLKNPQENKETLQKVVNQCLDDVINAKRNFKSKAFLELCAKLENYLNSIRRM